MQVWHQMTNCLGMQNAAPRVIPIDTMQNHRWRPPHEDENAAQHTGATSMARGRPAAGATAAQWPAHDLDGARHGERLLRHDFVAYDVRACLSVGPVAHRLACSLRSSADPATIPLSCEYVLAALLQVFHHVRLRRHFGGAALNAAFRRNPGPILAILQVVVC